MFEGSYVALITPFTRSGKLDEDALRRLVQWHIKNGSDGIVPVGTTGESPVLSEQEHLRVVELVVEEAAGKIRIIAGCGSNNTAEALKYHAHAYEHGADGALHVTGYYNRPSQEGIYQHFKALATLNDLPIIVYNVPARSVISIDIDTMARLSRLPSVIGVKDATRDLSRPCLEKHHIQVPFDFLSGEDATTVAYNAAGGRGCISVTANVAPKQCAEMQHACLAGDFQRAMYIQSRLTPLHQALFDEPSPAGIKYACSKVGLCLETIRLPLVQVTAKTRTTIDEALEWMDYD